MKEQIREFWDQAAKAHSGDSQAEQTAFLEKFAELIVRTCAGIAHGSDTPSKDIKDYFGLEE